VQNLPSPSAKIWLILLALLTDLDSINGGIKFSILVSLGDSNISPVSSDRHDSYGVLRVLLELHLAEGLGCFLL